MKNSFKVLGILVLVACIGFSVLACKKDSDEDTYMIFGSGLTSSEWDEFADFVGAPGLDPADLIDLPLDKTQRATIFAMMATDSDGLQKYGQSEDQIKSLLQSGGISPAFVSAIMAKLKAQGWVVYAMTPAADSGDYADIAAMRLE